MKKDFLASLPKELQKPMKFDPDPKKDPDFRYERDRRLKLLAKHWNLDISDSDFWQLLSLKLLEEIPGFQIAAGKARGRDQTWSESVYFLLWVEVEKQLEASPKKSLRAICSHLLNNKPWKNILARGREGIGSDKNGLETLYSHYMKALKSPWVIWAQTNPSHREALYKGIKTTLEGSET